MGSETKEICGYDLGADLGICVLELGHSGEHKSRPDDGENSESAERSWGDEFEEDTPIDTSSSDS